MKREQLQKSQFPAVWENRYLGYLQYIGEALKKP